MLRFNRLRSRKGFRLVRRPLESLELGSFDSAVFDEALTESLSIICGRGGSGVIGGGVGASRLIRPVRQLR
jgi:hypothetical protein